MIMREKKGSKFFQALLLTMAVFAARRILAMEPSDLPSASFCLCSLSLPPGPLADWGGLVRQDDPAYQPQVVSDGIAGKTAVKFNGRSFLDGQAVIPAHAVEFTYALVWQADASSPGGHSILEQSSQGPFHRAAFMLENERCGFVGEGNDALNMVEYPLNRPIVSLLRLEANGRVTLRLNGKLAEARVDRERIDIGDSILRLGARSQDRLCEFFSGRLGEVRIYDYALSDSEMDKVEDDLWRKWRLSANPNAAFRNADFELGVPEGWKITGDGFRIVETAEGKEAANQGGIGRYCLWGSRTGMGSWISDEFTIEHPYVNFKMGGDWDEENLTVTFFIDDDPKIVFHADNKQAMHMVSTHLHDFVGHRCRVMVRDSSPEGQLNVDEFTASDYPATVLFRKKNLKVTGRYLVLPVANRDGTKVCLKVRKGDEQVGEFALDMPRENHSPDWFTYWPAAAYLGEELELVSTGELEGALQPSLDSIHFADELPDAATDYQEPYRDQLHYTPRRGWTNDVNGLMCLDGRYHLFYQANPYGNYLDNLPPGNTEWGHAVSTDMIHWKPMDPPLKHPSRDDQFWSGGSFIDFQNISGFGTEEKPPFFIAFSSTGRGTCLAYSLDSGETFTEWAENNPMPPKIHGNDPFIFWYEPERKYCMVISEHAPDDSELPPALPNTPDVYARISCAFLSSTDLRHWKRESRFSNPFRATVSECPFMFQIAPEGRPENRKWVLMCCHCYYYIGEFDGHEFHSETGPHKFFVNYQNTIPYAGMLFSNLPDRNVAIFCISGGDYQSIFPEQRCMQGFSLPIEMTLHETAQGLRLHGNVVREFDELRKPVAIDIDNPTPEEAIRILQDYPGQLNDLTIRFTLEPGAKLQIDWGGIAYELTESGSIRIIEDISRHTAIINDGEALICPRKSPEKFFDRSCGLRIVNGYGVLENLTLYPLNSIYK